MLRSHVTALWLTKIHVELQAIAGQVKRIGRKRKRLWSG